MIKTSLVFFTLLLLLVNSLTAQQKSSKAAIAVQQTVVQFFDALSARDPIGLRERSANDIILYEHGKIWDMDSVVHYAITLNTDTAFKRDNHFEFLHISIAADVAWLSYNLISTVYKTGKIVTSYYQETIVAVKEKKQWKIKVLHSTVLKRDEAGR